jgi:hypothetical protein
MSLISLLEMVNYFLYNEFLFLFLESSNNNISNQVVQINAEQKNIKI